MSSLKFSTKSTTRKINRIFEILNTGDYTAQEMAPLVPISKRWCVDYLKHLAECGNVHISGWRMEVEGIKRYPRAIYRLGPGQPAQKPTPLTSKQKSIRRRAKKKHDDEFFFSERSKNRLRKFKPKPDIAASWLYAS